MGETLIALEIVFQRKGPLVLRSSAARFFLFDESYELVTASNVVDKEEERLGR